MLPKAPKKSKKSKKVEAAKSEETFEEGAERADNVARKMLVPALCMPDESIEEIVSLLLSFLLITH